MSKIFKKIPDIDLLGETLLVLVVRSFGALAIFGFNYVVAKHLNPIDAGYFFWTFSGLVIMVQISAMGFYDVAMKYVARYSVAEDWGRTAEVASKILAWISLSALSTVVLIAVFAGEIAEWFFPGADADKVADVIRMMAPAAVFSVVSLVLSYHLQGIGKPLKAVFVLSIGQYFTFCVLFYILGIKDPVTASLLYSISVFLNMVIACLWWWSALPAAPRVAVESGALWGMALPLWVIAVMSVVVNWGGQFLSGIWVGAADISHYAVALRAVALVNFVLIAMSFVVAPRIASLHAANERERLQDFVTSTIRFLYALTVPMVILICLFADEIMSLFGSDFSGSGQLLLILAAGQIVNVMTGPVGYLLAMTGHERLMRNMCLFSGSLCLLLIYGLTYRWGIEGTAWATSISILVQNLGATYLVRKKLGISISPVRW